MKIKNSKRTNLLIACISVLLVAVFAFTLVLSIIGNKASADTYTVYDDGEYYSETTYYLTENAYNKHIKETEATTADRKSVTKSSVSAEDNDSNFVIAATQKVCVYEVADENGNIAESRLLKKSEIEALNKNTNASTKKTSRYSIDKNNDNKINTVDEEVGSDGYTFNYLTIGLKVMYGNQSGQYIIEGTAGWEAKLVWAWDNNKAAEESYLDFLGITWGGNGNLQATDKTISGIYHNNKEVTYGRIVDEINYGYVWEFYEKTGWMGKEMKKTTASVTIDNQGIFHNQSTNARLTYIHTYGKIDGELTLSASSDDEVAAELTLSENKSSWATIINIPKIIY